MTRRRADRICRLVGVQREMQRAAEWTLHDLRRQEHDVQASQEEILAALASDDRLLFGLAPTLARRLSGLGAEADALAAAGDRQIAFMREQTGRLRQVERLEDVLRRDLGRAEEKSDFEDLLDLIEGGARAMLR